MLEGGLLGRSWVLMRSLIDTHVGLLYHRFKHLVVVVSLDQIFHAVLLLHCLQLDLDSPKRLYRKYSRDLVENGLQCPISERATWPLHNGNLRTGGLDSEDETYRTARFCVDGLAGD